MHSSVQFPSENWHTIFIYGVLKRYLQLKILVLRFEVSEATLQSFHFLTSSTLQLIDFFLFGVEQVIESLRFGIPTRFICLILSFPVFKFGKQILDPFFCISKLLGQTGIDITQSILVVCQLRFELLDTLVKTIVFGLQVTVFTLGIIEFLLQFSESCIGTTS